MLKKISFWEYSKKYKNLSGDDILLLENFFNKEKYFSVLEKYSILNINRLTSLMWYDWVIELQKSLHGFVLNDFLKEINKSLFYSYKELLFKDEISNIRSKSKLCWYEKFLGKYNEDGYIDNNAFASIFLDSDKFILSWVNLYSKHIDVDWNEKKPIDSAYLFKIKIKNPKRYIKKWIFLTKDKITNSWNFKIALIFAILFGLTLYFILNGLIIKYFFIYLILIFWSYFLFNFFYKNINNNKRTELDSVDFEKWFDVFSEDLIESRMVLTSSVMNNLNILKTAISKNRAYDIFFLWDEIYIKLDLISSNEDALSSKDLVTFLNFNWSIDNVLKEIVEFYLEIKWIIRISNYLWKAL